jgi:hypothetical protein
MDEEEDEDDELDEGTLSAVFSIGQPYNVGSDESKAPATAPPRSPDWSDEANPVVPPFSVFNYASIGPRIRPKRSADMLLCVHQMCEFIATNTSLLPMEILRVCGTGSFFRGHTKSTLDISFVYARNGKPINRSIVKSEDDDTYGSSTYQRPINRP